jgi:predicted O-methyltransferase YrrM
MNRTLRKLAQIPKLKSDELKAYLLSPYNKVHNRFHCKRLVEFEKNAIELPVLLGQCGLGMEIITQNKDAFEQYVSEANRYFSLPSTADITLCRLLYAITRGIKPANVMETGVWRGLSSFFLLSALRDNEFGHLNSVDFPPMDPAIRVVVGEAVPANLRDRWTLNVGPAASTLPRVCDRVANLDFFIHDSEHTYRNMVFEFEEAWKILKPGGLILVDDADWNDSVPDFCDSKGIPFYSMKREKGGYVVLMKKPNDS